MTNSKKAKIFSLRRLPMDIGRLVSAITLLLIPTKKIFLSESKKYIKGGALIASNHMSFKDPFIIGGAFWYRRVFFLAAESLMKNKFVAFLLREMGCIEINRNICDLTAIKKTVDKLKSGNLVAVFPQGGIRGDDMSALKSGIILMAIKSKRPIIPVYISSGGLFRRGVTVIGKHLSFDNLGEIPSVAEINKATTKLQIAMDECREHAEKTKEIKNNDNHRRNKESSDSLI